MNELLIDNQGAVRLLTLNRPERHNALNTALTQALLNALREASADDSCRAIVLTGAGKSFCAGADTGEFAALSGDDGSAAAARADLTASLHGSFTQVTKPVVTAVHGNALGGGAGLALAGDLMLAADDMRFGYPELKHGIVAAIVMANLVRQLGQKTAFSLVATGRLIDGPKAVALGIALESAPADALVERAIALAHTLAAWSPVAMATTKKLFYQVADLTLAEGLQAGRDTNLRMRNFGKPAAPSPTGATA